MFLLCGCVCSGPVWMCILASHWVSFRFASSRAARDGAASADKVWPVLLRMHIFIINATTWRWSAYTISFYSGFFFYFFCCRLSDVTWVCVSVCQCVCFVPSKKKKRELGASATTRILRCQHTHRDSSVIESNQWYLWCGVANNIGFTATEHIEQTVQRPSEYRVITTFELYLKLCPRQVRNRNCVIRVCNLCAAIDR